MILYHLYCSMMAHANLNGPFCPAAAGNINQANSASVANGGDTKVETVVNIYSPVSTSSNAANAQHQQAGVPVIRMDTKQRLTLESRAELSGRSLSGEIATDQAELPSNLPSETISDVIDPNGPLREFTDGTIPITETHSEHGGLIKDDESFTSTASPLDNLPTSTFPSIPPFNTHPMFSLQGIQNFAKPRVNSRMSLDIMRRMEESTDEVEYSDITPVYLPQLTADMSYAKAYILRSLYNTTLNTNFFASPAAIVSLLTTTQYLFDGCVYNEKRPYLEQTPSGGSMKEKYPYREIIIINKPLKNFTDETCDLNNLQPSLTGTLIKNEPSSSLTMAHTFKMSLTWSMFSSEHCTTYQDNFQTNEFKYAKTNYTTLYGPFVGYYASVIQSPFVILPIPGYESLQWKIIIIKPYAVKNIIALAAFIHSFLEPIDFLETPPARNYTKIVLPTVKIFNIYPSYNAVANVMKFTSLVKISTSDDSPLCNIDEHENSEDVFKVNRPFIFMLVWKEKLAATGIVFEMNN